MYYFIELNYMYNVFFPGPAVNSEEKEMTSNDQ